MGAEASERRGTLASPPAGDQGRGGEPPRARWGPGPSTWRRRYLTDFQPTGSAVAAGGSRARQPRRKEGSQRGIWDPGRRAGGNTNDSAGRARAWGGRGPAGSAPATRTRRTASNRRGESHRTTPAGAGVQWRKRKARPASGEGAAKQGQAAGGGGLQHRRRVRKEKEKLGTNPGPVEPACDATSCR